MSLFPGKRGCTRSITWAAEGQSSVTERERRVFSSTRTRTTSFSLLLCMAPRKREKREKRKKRRKLDKLLVSCGPIRAVDRWKASTIATFAAIGFVLFLPEAATLPLFYSHGTTRTSVQFCFALSIETIETPPGLF